MRRDTGGGSEMGRVGRIWAGRCEGRTSKGEAGNQTREGGKQLDNLPPYSAYVNCAWPECNYRMRCFCFE
ncbi:hypothetical protein E2C01_006216 [Portunus trituberculatus]|uniref:Uncharacterized protein n=1 Tax=Portunus trituberculatus TaxID=210409 RepID=A0A5B7CVP9_PORTR|nr:hypothetical protein [Portunus trituberculatus]